MSASEFFGVRWLDTAFPGIGLTMPAPLAESSLGVGKRSRACALQSALRALCGNSLIFATVSKGPKM